MWDYRGASNPFFLLINPTPETHINEGPDDDNEDSDGDDEDSDDENGAVEER